MRPARLLLTVLVVAALSAGCGATLPGLEVGVPPSGSRDTSGAENQPGEQAQQDTVKPSVPLAYTEVGSGEFQQTVVRLAANTSLRRLYALQSGRGPLAVLDAATGKVISTITIGAAPTDLAVEAATNRLYVTDSTDGLRVIDAVSQSVVQQIPIPGARAVAVDQPGGRLFVLQAATTTTPARVRVFDLASYADQGAITPDATYAFDRADLAADPATHRLYVARVPRAQGPDQVAIYDGMSRAFVASVAMPAEAGAVVPGDGRLYVAVVGKERGVAIVDTAKNVVLAFIKSATGGPQLAVRGTRAYTGGGGANVQVFDLALRRWLGEYPASGDVVAMPGSDRLYVAGKGLAIVAEAPAKTQNPSFEADANTDGIPDGWTGSGLAAADRLTTEKHLDGERAFILAGGGTKSLRQTLGLAGKKGETVSLMAWALPKDAASDAVVKAVVRYASGQTDTILLTFSAKPEAWQVKAAELRAKDAFDRVTVIIEYAGSAGAYWFDYVLLGAPLSGDATVIEEK